MTSIGKFEIVAVSSMTIAIVFMSFTFPALGLTGDEVDEDDIPDFNISSDTFDLTGDFPDRPTTPSGGEFVYDQQREGTAESPERDREWLVRDASETPAQVQLMFIPSEGVGTPGGDDEMQAQIRTFDASGTLLGTDESANMSNVSDEVTVSNATAGFTAHIQLTSFEDPDTEDMTATADWQILEGPLDQQWYSGIPIIGGLFATGEQVAGTVQWLITVAFWALLFPIEIFLNVAVTIVSATVYLISLLQWVVGEYTAIVDAASNWATVIVAIPGIVITLIFGKVVWAIISDIWIG